MKDCPWEKFKEKDRVSFTAKLVVRCTWITIIGPWIPERGLRFMTVDNCQRSVLKYSDQDKARTGRVQKN